MNDQEAYFGVGSIKALKKILETLDTKRAFLVTGKESFVSSGASKEIEPILGSYETQRFSDFSANPKIEDIEKGIAQYKHFSPDVVIAIGGGSVIDTAKAINILANQKKDTTTYVQGVEKLEPCSVPLIAMPTTSGSGAEATHFAVVYVGKIKYSLAHSTLVSRFSIIDPELTYSLGSSITRATGLDALAQAIESYWSVRSTDVSKGYAKEALVLAYANLKEAVLAPSEQSRIAMSKAAHLAGKAINISKTTASHALSYPLTMHFGIPHGEAVALTLSQVLLYNSRVTESDCNDPRGFQYVQNTIVEIIEILGVKTPSEAAEVLDTLFGDIGLELTLAKRGISPNDLDMILAEASSERMGNNPRKISEIDARKILESIICN